MGRLAGFRYRDIVKRIRRHGFIFDRQAAGSHEIWYNPSTNLYTTIPNHPGEMPEGTLQITVSETISKPWGVAQNFKCKMPYPIRFFLPGQVWHITHRCHDRNFLLGQAVYRDIWVKWLYAAKDKYETNILNYVVTSNHIHLLVLASENREAIPRTMQLVASRTGFEYNRRKNRKGAFWEKRYTATAVQKDEHLIRCSLYIDINMVRAGAVKHPRQWKHGGYNEIVKPKQRYRLIDHASLRRLTDFDDNDSLTAQYKSWISNTLKKGNLSRDDIWTSDVAVGDESFVNNIRKRLGFIGQKKPPISAKGTEINAVREESPQYGEATVGNELEWEIFSDM